MGDETRRRIPVRQRVGAVVAAVRQMDHEMTADNHAGTLTVLLGEAWVDFGRVREVLDLVLASCIAGRTRDGVAYLRLAVANFETALGLEHDPRSAEALQTWERAFYARSGGSPVEVPKRADWHSYVARAEAECRTDG